MSDERNQRRIRSFVLRTGRMTPGQQHAFDDNWSRWGLEVDAGFVDTSSAFGRCGPCVLEIGFGMGQSLVTMANSAPDINYIGVEVHRPGVGKLFHSMREQGVDNIRAYCHDAVEVLQQCIPNNFLDGVQIFFPDPWHKKRHHKRRLIQPDFVANLIPHIKPGGFIHLATDWENYAEQMLEVLSANPDLENRDSHGGYIPRPDHRPLTKFEQRGERLGHGVWDLMFLRR